MDLLGIFDRVFGFSAVKNTQPFLQLLILTTPVLQEKKTFWKSIFFFPASGLTLKIHDNQQREKVKLTVNARKCVPLPIRAPIRIRIPPLPPGFARRCLFAVSCSPRFCPFPPLWRLLPGYIFIRVTTCTMGSLIFGILEIRMFRKLGV